MGTGALPYPSRGYEGFQGRIEEVSSTSVPAWPAERRAGKGAPNVVVVLLDDLGFSDVSPFGGEIDTPNLASLAEAGYRFTNYHSAPVCSPARAALLTGLNPHRAGFSSVAHADPGFPGYTLEIADDVPTIAESFRAGGYATFMVGKWHLTKESKMHDGADKASWPCQRGFDRYYGCMDGFTTLFQPHRLVQDNTPLVIDDFPEDYFLTDDLTNQALRMIKSLRANDADKPFFLYFAHQAVHGPIQAKEEDIVKYRGAYEAGWDHVRDERFRRQVREGLFPAETALPTEQEPGLEILPWDNLSEEQKLLFARYMEVYAASVDNVDHNLGRLLNHLKEIGEYENTIVVFASDNGGTAEGGPDGTRSYFSQFIHLAGLPADWDRDVSRDLELIGGPRAFAHYPRGWARASNTPLRLYKGHTFAGGIRVPLLVSWPAGLPRAAEDNGIRSQFAYVTDLGQTLLGLAGVEHLRQRHGQQAKEVDGASFESVLRNSSAPATRNEQYTEFIGHRGYFCDQWKIVTEHRFGEPFSDDEWELYDIAADPTETVNLATAHPEKVAELAEKWRAEAWNNTVFPLNDDGSLFRIRPSTELVLSDPVTLYPGTPTLERYRSSKLIHLRSFDITADFDYHDGDSGVLLAHGDQGGGYVVFVQDHRLCLSYNEYGRMHRASSPIRSTGPLQARLTAEALPDVKWTLRLELAGAAVQLEPVLQLVGMSPFTGISVGVDRGSPVDWELYEGVRSGRYTGTLRRVRYEPGPMAVYNPEIIINIEREVERIYE